MYLTFFWNRPGGKFEERGRSKYDAGLRGPQEEEEDEEEVDEDEDDQGIDDGVGGDEDDDDDVRKFFWGRFNWDRWEKLNKEILIMNFKQGEIMSYNKFNSEVWLETCDWILV